MAPHYTPYDWLHVACGWLLRSSQAVVTRDSDKARSTATRPSECLCSLRLFQGTTWVYVTYGLDSALRLVYRGSEKSPLNLHFLVLRRDTQVGSRVETVEPHHGNRKDPLTPHNFQSCLSISSTHNHHWLKEIQYNTYIWKRRGFPRRLKLKFHNSIKSYRSSDNKTQLTPPFPSTQWSKV
jgi:hypothetical protein